MSGNPFHNDLVIEVMLEEADVDTLKTLRKMNSFWNKLDLKELEKRAVGGQLGELDFSDGAQKRLKKFLQSSSKIPLVFRSFYLHFPYSLKFIDSSFFTQYPPIFLHLEFYEKTHFTKDVTTSLVNFFTWIAPTVQELWVERIDRSAKEEQVIQSPSNVPPLVFPKLTELTWDMGDDGDDSKDHIPFKFILDRGADVDPTPNLTTLGACINEDFLKMMINGPSLFRWSTLTNLRIYESCGGVYDGCSSFVGQSRDVSKRVAVSFWLSPLEDSQEMCGNWSYFLETQAKSLEILEIEWYFGDEVASDEMEDSKIKLPIFKSLKTLHLFMHYTPSPPGGLVQSRMFRTIKIPVHFPKLDHFHANQEGYLNIFPLDGEPIPLNSLTIYNYLSKWQGWTAQFPSSLKSLFCKGGFFEIWGQGAELSSEMCLKVLEIDRVNFPLKLSHLTSLRELIVLQRDRWNKLPSDYLSIFQQVLTLKLSSITFNSWDKPSDEVKARFVEHFPFPVKFKQPITFDDDHGEHFPFNH